MMSISVQPNHGNVCSVLNKTNLSINFKRLQIIQIR